MTRLPKDYGIWEMRIRGYVEWDVDAIRRGSEAIGSQVAPEPTSSPEAIPRPCMRPSQRFWRQCPPGGRCAEVGQCVADIDRLDVILRAYQAVREIRGR